MTIYTAPNMSSGFDDALVGVVTAVPSFIPAFLFFVFGVIFLGGTIAQKKRLGSADMPMWAANASLITMVVSLLLSLRQGLMSIQVLGVVITITIASGVWLFFDRNRNEI